MGRLSIFEDAKVAVSFVFQALVNFTLSLFGEVPVFAMFYVVLL